MNPLFILGIGGVLMLLYGFRRQTQTAQKITNRISSQNQFVPKILHVAIVATQLYELVLVVEHASFVTLSGAIMLFAIVTASRTGTEEYITDSRQNKISR